MYSPTLGRWIQNDPIGFEGGDNDLYGFVGNDPANRLDPSGLLCAQNQPAQAPAIKYNPQTLGEYFKEFNTYPAGPMKDRLIERNKQILGFDFSSKEIQAKHKDDGGAFFVANQKSNGQNAVTGGFATYVKFSVDNFNTIPAADATRDTFCRPWRPRTSSSTRRERASVRQHNTVWRHSKLMRTACRR